MSWKTIRLQFQQDTCPDQILFESSNEADLITRKLQHFLEQLWNVNSEGKCIFLFQQFMYAMFGYKFNFLDSS